jgi:hypothetical protein
MCNNNLLNRYLKYFLTNQLPTFLPILFTASLFPLLQLIFILEGISVIMKPNGTYIPQKAQLSLEKLIFLLKTGNLNKINQLR